MFQYASSPDYSETVRKSTSSSSYYNNPEDNEILGSGNFDIIKGGTFYDADDYQYIPTR